MPPVYDSIIVRLLLLTLHPTISDSSMAMTCFGLRQVEARPTAPVKLHEPVRGWGMPYLAQGLILLGRRLAFVAFGHQIRQRLPLLHVSFRVASSSSPLPPASASICKLDLGLGMAGCDALKHASELPKIWSALFRRRT